MEGTEAVTSHEFKCRESPETGSRQCAITWPYGRSKEVKKGREYSADTASVTTSHLARAAARCLRLHR